MFQTRITFCKRKSQCFKEKYSYSQQPRYFKTLSKSDLKGSRALENKLKMKTYMMQNTYASGFPSGSGKRFEWKNLQLKVYLNIFIKNQFEQQCFHLHWLDT